jgi:hypothetical protein
MKPARALTALLALVAVAAGAALGASRPAAAAAPAIDKVLIISTPRLTWKVVADNKPPELLRLFSTGAVASMSLRTVSARTTAGEGYATIGAGNRATVNDLTAGLAFGRDETVEGSPVPDVYRRRIGQPPAGSVFELGLADSQRRNSRLLYGARIGSLGTALASGGKRAAVIANADSDPTTSLVNDYGRHREAAMAVMDRDGRIAGGAVDDSLLLHDDTAPFGRRLDPGKVAASFADAWAGNDVVLVELSDLERADAYGDVATPAARRDARAAAVRRSDELVGALLRTIDRDRTLVLVVSPVAPRAGEQLGVAAIAGPGIKPGLARSATTRRTRYVTLPDVAPTVLHALHIHQPRAMNGTAFSSSGGRPPGVATARSLAADSALTVFRDRATGPVSVVFVVFQVLVYAAAAVALTSRWGRRALRPIAYCSLLVLAVPFVGFTSGLFHYDRLGQGGYLVTVFAASALLAAVAWIVGGARRHFAPGVLIGATYALLLLDVIAGGPLQLNTVFGYSPIVAGRFSGYGNLAYGLLAMTAIVTATVLWRLFPRRPVALAAAATVLAVAVIVDGAPSWGSDVGGVLASGPAFMVVLALLAGWQVNWRRLVAAGLATIAAVGCFGLVDLARPADSRTHLGRLLADPGELGDTVRRKLASNINILTSSIWTLIIPVALAFLIVLALRPPGLLREIQRNVPGLRACLVGGLLAGLLGFALNDSGVAVPAMMLAVLLPYLTFVLATAPVE